MKPLLAISLCIGVLLGSLATGAGMTVHAVRAADDERVPMTGWFRVVLPTGGGADVRCDPGDTLIVTPTSPLSAEAYCLGAEKE